jgi:hypothetical protein
MVFMQSSSSVQSGWVAQTGASIRRFFADFAGMSGFSRCVDTHSTGAEGEAPLTVNPWIRRRFQPEIQ